MVKILTGLVAAIVIAVAGFFGFQFYTQHRVAGEVDAAFEQIRAAGGKVSHGPVSFDLWSRTVKIADIASESASQPPVTVKIASVTASGVTQPDATRFSAANIDASDIEVAASGPAQAAAWQLSYKVPQVTVKDYSGPVMLHRPPASASLIDIYRSTLEQFVGMSASSVSIPNVTGAIHFGAAVSGDFTYSGVTLHDIKNGKVATIQAERAGFTVDTQQGGKPDKIAGEIVNIATHDFDATAVAAILDPQNAKDDRYYRAYGQTTTGAYTFTSTSVPGLRMRIEAVAIDDVGVRPSRLQLPALMAMMPPAGAAPPSPAQARDMLERVAAIYEGIRIGNAEMRGMSVETPQGPVKLAAVRFNLENGKIGEFAVEGLDARSAKGPIKVGRFALKSLDLANLMRLTAQFSTAARKPSPDQLAGMLALLEGVEVKGLEAPFKDTGKPVTVDAFDLNWGQFVGPIPSKIRLTAKMATPIDPNDAMSKPLVAAGLDTLAADCDVSTAWTEASQTFVLDAPALDLDRFLKASVRISFGNVPRHAFSIDPQQAAAVAAQIEAGAIELTLRDAGGVDMLVTQYARTQDVSIDAARQAIVATIRADGAETAETNPDAAAIVEALVHFIENPKTALTLKLTPRDKVPAIELVRAMQSDPTEVLTQFSVEASTAP